MKTLNNQMVEIKGSESFRIYHVIEEKGTDIRLMPMPLEHYPLNLTERYMVKVGGIWLQHDDVIIC